MKRLSLILFSILIVLNLVSCGTSVADTSVEDSNVVAETETSEPSENESETPAEEPDKAGIEVDENIFTVELTIPADFVGETTQEELDNSVEEKGYKSATLNDDGSVTYVMSKSQHEELLKGIAESIDKSMEEMVGSEDYPNYTSVTANKDYTSFTIVTTSEELNMAESFSIIAFYMFGGMYGAFAGEPPENVHVEFVNEATGEVISSSDSSEMSTEE